MDRLTPQQRHKNMSHVKSKDSRIELTLRRALWERGIRYRKNFASLPGKPDLAITKYRIAIFCDSEFFHGKDWENLEKQLARGNNAEFWIKKITNNRARDEAVNRELRYLGWRVLRFWGKDIMKNTQECIRRVEEEIFRSRLENHTALEEGEPYVSID